MYEGIENEIGDLLKRNRQKRGWTQYELAKKSRLTVGAIHMLEHGKNHPSMITLCKLSDAFGVTIDELLGLCSPTSQTKKFVVQREGHLARCPTCRKMVVHGSNAQMTDNYCPRCGQALRWE